MIIQLELPPDVEARLRKNAARHDVEAVRRLLTEVVAPVVDATVDALIQDPLHGAPSRADGLTDTDFEALVDQLVSMPSVPTLSDASISRAGIYTDHL